MDDAIPSHHPCPGSLEIPESSHCRLIRDTPASMTLVASRRKVKPGHPLALPGCPVPRYTANPPGKLTRPAL